MSDEQTTDPNPKTSSGSQTVELLRGLGSWVSQYGISTVLLLAGGYWFTTGWAAPLLQAHLRHVEQQAAVLEQQAATLERLEKGLEKLRASVEDAQKENYR